MYVEIFIIIHRRMCDIYKILQFNLFMNTITENESQVDLNNFEDETIIFHYSLSHFGVEIL